MMQLVGSLAGCEELLGPTTPRAQDPPLLPRAPPPSRFPHLYLRRLQHTGHDSKTMDASSQCHARANIPDGVEVAHWAPKDTQSSVIASGLEF